MFIVIFVNRNIVIEYVLLDLFNFCTKVQPLLNKLPPPLPQTNKQQQKQQQ